MIGFIILAGGQGARMGGVDKGWCVYQGKPFIEWVLQGIESQYGASEAQIYISANRSIQKYQEYSYPVVKDVRRGFCGPLAGVEAIMNDGDCSISRWITWPVDCLYFDSHYLQLMANLPEDVIGVLNRNGRQEFAHLSIPQNKKFSITDYLNQQKRSVRDWLKGHHVQQVSDSGLLQTSKLFNVNYPILSS